MFRTQKSGKQSTNIQTESLTINQGLFYTDVRDIALDVFKSNFLQLSEQAAIIARTRAEEITDKFLKELEEQHNSGVINAQDPDFQHALFTVQKEYARTGDKELGDLLVDLLVDRTKHDKRNILQIVLNESLSVAPKLTNEQIAALSLVFIIRYTVFRGLTNLTTFLEFLDLYIAPFVNLLTKSSSCYQHLEFAGCGSIGINQVHIIDTFKNNYIGLFSKGFTEADIEERNIKLSDYPTLFTKCLHDSNKLQTNAISEEVLRSRVKQLGISEENINSIIALSNSFLMSDDEIKNYIIHERSYMEKVSDIWDGSYIKNLTLTSVGIAIGHANVKKSTGEFTDLSIWIN
ncbi:MAG: LPO_1073/Vpar_1526 family protein [Clostridia bacterium]